MKFSLFVSRPSAIQATFTPAPVMPSDAAVLALGLSEAVWVSDSPSGASCGLVLHAPGITFGVGVAAEALADVEDLPVVAGAVVESGPPRLTLIIELGMTWATPGSALSLASSPAETVAANELTVRNCRTWLA